MLNITQRIELMRLSSEIAKAKFDWAETRTDALEDAVLVVFEKLRVVVEKDAEIDDTSMSDVKAAVDVVSEISGLLD